MTCCRTCQDTSDTPCTWSELTGSKWVPQDYCQVHFIVKTWLRNHTSVARKWLISAPTQPSAVCVCLSFNVWACLDRATFGKQEFLEWKNAFEVCGKEITSQNKLLGLDEDVLLTGWSNCLHPLFYYKAPRRPCFCYFCIWFKTK